MALEEELETGEGITSEHLEEVAFDQPLEEALVGISKLARRVLVQTIEELQKGYAAMREYPEESSRYRNGRRLYNSALRWLKDPDRSGAFSYYSVCELIELEPESLRRSIFEKVGLE